MDNQDPIIVPHSMKSEDPAVYEATLLVQARWIPVSVALPPYDQRKLLTLREYESGQRRVVIGWRWGTTACGERWKAEGRDLIDDEVLAWSEMPPPHEG